MNWILIIVIVTSINGNIKTIEFRNKKNCKDTKEALIATGYCKKELVFCVRK